MKLHTSLFSVGSVKGVGFEPEYISLHSDHDQGGQNPPSCDLSQNIFSSMHSISPKFRERSGNGQTWLNPKFE